MFKSLHQGEFYKFSLTGSIIFLFFHSVISQSAQKRSGPLLFLIHIRCSLVPPSLRSIHIQHLLHCPNSNTHSMNQCFNALSLLRLAAASTRRTRLGVSKKEILGTEILLMTEITTQMMLWERPNVPILHSTSLQISDKNCFRITLKDFGYINYYQQELRSFIFHTLPKTNS